MVQNPEQGEGVSRARPQDGATKPREAAREGWVVRNVPVVGTGIRATFGVVELIAGLLKFQPGMASVMTQQINDVGVGQPSWLAPWFSFWGGAFGANAGTIVPLVGTLEILLGITLITGLMQKVAYTGGIALNLMIWSIPEGFGGLFVGGGVDVGAAIIYVFVFALLLVLNAASAPNRYSLDYYIEKRLPIWRKLAEVRRAPSPA